MQRNSIKAPLFGANTVFIEELYTKFLNDNNSVDPSWRDFFSDMGDSVETIIKNHRGASWAPNKSAVIGAKDPDVAVVDKKKSIAGPVPPVSNQEDTNKACSDSIGALMLIRAYKVRGNLLADLDPLGIEGRKNNPDLLPQTYGFSEQDYNREIYLGGALGLQRSTLNKLIEILKQTYSSKIGVEFMHIPDLEQRDWIAERMEAVRGRPKLTSEAKKSILNDIIKFELFEQFLHIKYPGAKRFSAEGGEAAFAAMEQIIDTAVQLGIKEIVIGMPHRGRLNVLTKIMGRKYSSMLSEFQGYQAFIAEEVGASGDVKYHQGASSDREIRGKKIHLSLSANPSHLEAVNPVVVGRVRAKQDIDSDSYRRQTMGLLLHGDAAFAGQGIVPETLALSDLDGYTTGGTLHIIVNNQIGFTTSPKNARKSPYPSDIAKGIHAPIFHVNGDDPEAVVFVSNLAVEFRQKFGKDVVVDVFCYRKYGHNEGDEPFFTQPIMYSNIAKHKTPMEVYSQKLIEQNIITEGEYDALKKEFLEFLEKEFEKSKKGASEKADWLEGQWKGFISPLRTNNSSNFVDTGFDLKKLKKIGNALATYPKHLKINSKLVRLLEAKKKMIEVGSDFDWAMGEALAFASLLSEGFPVRLSGQDSERGTFSHRHSALIDQETEEHYYPLNNLGVDQAFYEVINSNLSEFAVLGFEYGYSLARPNSLVLWEAQFGDFANGAQVIIDQFIASSEIKWLRMSGLVMLLPHGYEGQGPEHSSARLERYLQLCAEDNLQVVNCTTPASYFHALRRQLHRNFRKPLIVMTPKSLLRHKLCVSSASDFAPGKGFNPVIGETEKLLANDKIKKVVICSGKIYYELLEERNNRKINDIAIIRMEQYHPFPKQELQGELKKYKNAQVIWCQEEPQNMGAWTFLDRKIEDTLSEITTKASRPQYVGRPASASTAAGYMKIHQKWQKAIIEDALRG